MTYTEKDLLTRNFTCNTWTDEGETFTEYVLQKDNVKIEISGISLIEIAIGDEYTEAAIDTLAELDNLIKYLCK